MKVVAMLLRYYSSVFAIVFGLFLAGISSVLLISGATNFKFEMIPYWKGDPVLYWLLGIGLFGVIAGVLGLRRQVRALLLLFCLLVCCLFVYGFYISPIYRFQGAPEAKNSLWLLLAALVALAGSFCQFEKPKKA